MTDDGKSVEMACPFCGASEVALLNRLEQVTMKGRKIAFIACQYRCRACQYRFDTEETMSWNLESARRVYNNLQGGADD